MIKNICVRKMCVCVSVCVYVRTHIRMYVCMYVCMYVRTYVCMYVRMYACMYVCMHACICTYASAYAHAYLCACIQRHLLLHMPVWKPWSQLRQPPCVCTHIMPQEDTISRTEPYNINLPGLLLRKKNNPNMDLYFITWSPCDCKYM